MSRWRWKTVQIRRELYEEVKKIVQKDPRYHSINEFVAEAVRLRLEQIRCLLGNSVKGDII